MTLIDGISADPTICHGQAVITGTRIPVGVVLDSLAEGLTHEELLEEFPTLSSEGIRAALAYGAWVARDEIVPA